MTDKNLEKKVNAAGIKMVASAATGLVTALGGIIVASNLGKTQISLTDQYLIATGAVLCTGYALYNLAQGLKYANEK